MKIECLDRSVEQVLSDAFYKIPRFQRPYSWDEENIREFINDTLVEDENGVFIGSVVVSREDPKSMNIVDGQQRFTTITLLLAAIRNRMVQAGLSDQANGVNRLIVREDINNKKRPVLDTQSGYPFIHSEIQGRLGVISKSYKPTQDEQLMVRAYFQIDDWLSSYLEEQAEGDSEKASNAKWLESRLPQLRDKLLHLMLIRITLDNEDDAYLIFETLNTRGKDLTVADMVKSYLLRLLPQKTTNADTSKERWEKLNHMLSERSLGTSTSDFLLHYWLSAYEYVGAKKLFRSIKKEIRKENAKSFLDTVESEANSYKVIHKPTTRKWRLEETTLKESLAALQLFRIKQQLPMVMAVLRQYDSGLIKLRQAKKALWAIEAFHFKFTAVSSERSSGGVSQMYSRAARQLSGAKAADVAGRAIDELIDKLRERVPSEAAFQSAFMELEYDSSNSNRQALVRYILERIDRHHNKSDAPLDYSGMTIEHILAKSTKSQDSDAVPRIGNLLLLDPTTNAALGARDFAAKKAVYTTKSRTWIDPLIKDADTWGELEITERGVWLAGQAYTKVWTF